MESESKAKANLRKRPFTQDSTSLETASLRGASHNQPNAEPTGTAKRNRTAEWPLKNSIEPTGDDFVNSKPATNPLTQNQHSRSSTRPSKFKEGSLNDRPSQEPPASYIDQEHTMDQWSKSQERGSEDMDVDYNAGIESSKPSGVFRFGKAIANVLNPMAFWHGMNGAKKEKDQRASTEETALQDRREKANRAYAELKKNGSKGTQPAAVPRVSKEIPVAKYQEREDSRRNSFRDSAIDVDEYLPSSTRSEAPVANEGLKPPSTKAHARSISPLLVNISARKSSSHLRTPSFQSLKKVKSHIQLPSRRQGTEVPPLPLVELNGLTTQVPAQGLHRQASKKDITKQYKLSKRVSDLESKLDSARRELEKSMHDAPPVPDLPARIGRKPFKPGGLASLPSERTLMSPSHNTDGKGVQQITSKVNVAIQPDAQDNAEERGAQQHDLQSKSWLELGSEVSTTNHFTSKPKDTKPSTQKDDMKHASVEAANKALWAAAKQATTKGKATRRKSLPPQDPIRPSPTGIKKHQPKVPLKTPRNSPLKPNENVPPIPSSIPLFDPTKVDQAQILSMRAIPGRHVPFGKAPDDLVNLRKEHPSATEAHLVAYLAGLPDTNKKTDHTSISHQDCPASPFLSQPAMSPMQTRSRVRKRGVSPPPPSLASAKKLRAGKGAERLGKENARPGEKDSVTATVSGKENARVSMDKPLPDIQREEFEWDEDVF